MTKVSTLPVLAMLLAASVALGHHSLSAEFDLTRTTAWKDEVVSLD